MSNEVPQEEIRDEPMTMVRKHWMLRNFDGAAPEKEDVIYSKRHITSKSAVVN